MRRGRIIKIISIAAGIIMLLSGLTLFIAPLFWNSHAGYEGTYRFRTVIRAFIGEGVSIDDDTTIALSLLCIFQGIRLLEGKKAGPGSIIYSFWLFIPALLAVEIIDSAPGIIPVTVARIFPGEPPASLILSVFLTILFRMLLSMSGNVGETVREDGQRALLEDRKVLSALPYPEEQEEKQEIICEFTVPSDTEESTTDDNEKKELPPVIQKLVKTAKPMSYQGLVRARKKLLAMEQEELADATNSIKGFRVYADKEGVLGNIENEMSSMIAYLFAPFTLIAVNKKGNIRRIECNDMAVPAFSMDQAEELAKAAVEGYSKGGYTYASTEKPISISGKRMKVGRQDFVVPWYRKELTYDDTFASDKLFAWDFRLKYAPERGLVPFASED